MYRLRCALCVGRAAPGKYPRTGRWAARPPLVVRSGPSRALVSGVPVPRSPPSPVTWPNGQNETHGIALLDYRGRAIPVIAQLTHGAGATQRHRYDVAQGRIAERKAG